MTTMMPPRRPAGSAPRPPVPASPPSAAASGVVPIDPIKLLKQYYIHLVAALVAGVVLGVIAHFALLRVSPSYHSTVIYDCRPPITDPIGIDERPPSDDELERFMGTQLQALTSHIVLSGALNEPQVRNTDWIKKYTNEAGVLVKPEEALNDLERMTRANAVPRTNWITLRVSARTAPDAAVIVNAIDRVYRNELTRRQRDETADRRQTLNQRLNDIQSEIARLTRERERILAEGEIDTLDERLSNEVLRLSALLGQHQEAASMLSQLQTRLNEYIAAMQAEAGINYSESLRERANFDRIVMSFDSQIKMLEAHLGAMEQRGFGPQHPEARRIRASIDAQKRKRQEHYEDTLQRLFNAELEMMRSQIMAFQGQLSEIRVEIESVNRRREEIVQAKVRYNEYEERIAQLREKELHISTGIDDIETIRQYSASTRVVRWQGGQVPERPAFPRLLIMVPAGAILAVGLVGGLIFLREMLDQRIKGPSDLGLIARIRILGTLPDASEDPSQPKRVETTFRDNPTGVVTESFRQLRAPLARRMQESGHRSLLVLSAMPGSGGTTVAANLAIAGAAGDQKVLLIDANFRRPSIHTVFGLSDGPGLGDVLAGQSEFASAVRESGAENLSILTSGSSQTRLNPERLSTPRMQSTLLEAVEKYDLVILDAPPVVVSGDGQALANLCDATALVVRAMAEKRGMVARIASQLSEARGELLGVIVNRVRSAAGGYMKRNIRAAHEYQRDNGRAQKL